MELSPGRAPFKEDEDYTPLRMPKSAATTPTHGAQAYQVQGGGTGGGGTASGSLNNVATPVAIERTVSPTKLSPFAKEFVPRFGGGPASGSGAGDRLEQQQRHQQQYNQQNYHQYQQPHRQQRRGGGGGGGGGSGYANGYQHQQHYGQQHHQQVASLTGSVQERLKIGSAGPGSLEGGNKGGNYYPNQSRHHQNKQQHHNQHNPQYHQNRHHQQQQHRGYHHQQQQQHAAASSPGGAANSPSEVETIALDYLRTVIQCLNQNPGQFDTVATRFLTIFDGMENNQYVLSNAMEDIFQESIQNPNFRYMGAKLYNLLHMLNLKRDSLFHTLLKCKLDYHQQEVAQFMASNQQTKVRETALFLAELYMQLRGDDSRIHLIAENIVYSLKQLLSAQESADNVRCICLTLKLAGYDLTADCAAAMHEIITQLQEINAKSPGKYPLAANVIALQKNNWGRKVSSSNSLCDPSETPLKAPEPLRTSDEPIFYGPDGRELTAEESDFLARGATGMGATGGSTDDEDLGDLDVDLDPEMDEETELAYKEFCKLNSTI